MRRREVSYGLAALMAAQVAVALWVGGCSDPRFEEATLLRWGRIDQYVTEAQLRETDCARRLAATNADVAKDIKIQDRHFRLDIDRASRSYAEEAKRWEKERVKREASLRKLTEGDSENARRTAREMAY